ncbi:LysM peptidoglycan-binding domain-containing protein [Microbacterium sp.]|uniref:LysM peptidoglycan-binding domain-containing protein n=1 Tax=Microbacterium sp. TaxID=51671 RepID=UPI0039E57BF2
MSTIDIAGVYAPVTRLRLTVRGRRVLAAAASIPAVVALSVAIVSGGGALASDERATPEPEFATVSVLPGDSLWSIAETIAPGEDPRDVVDAVMRLNGLTTSALDVGQSLAIPHEYTR